MQVLSTDAVAEPDRFELWRDLICATFVHLDCEPVGPTPPVAFSGRIVARDLGPIRVSEVLTCPQHVVRSHRQIAAANEDDVLVSLQLSEECRISQDDRTATIRRGDFALYDTSRPYSLHMERPFRQLVWQMPRTMLLDRAPALDARTAVTVPGDRGVGAVVSTFLTALAGRLDEVSEAEGTRMVPLVADLLASALGTAARSDVEPSSMARLHLERARAHIDRHLTDPALDPSHVAGGVAVSVRYLHQLFAAEGTSPARQILVGRLDRASRQLRDPALRHLTVTQVAFGCGFRDAAHFSRAFRRHFGAPPSEYRAAAPPVVGRR